MQWNQHVFRPDPDFYQRAEAPPKAIETNIVRGWRCQVCGHSWVPGYNDENVLLYSLEEANPRAAARWERMAAWCWFHQYSDLL